MADSKIKAFGKWVLSPGVKLIRKIGDTKFGHALSSWTIGKKPNGWKPLNWLSRHTPEYDSATGKWQYETIPGKTKTWVKQEEKTGDELEGAKVAQYITSAAGEAGVVGYTIYKLIQLGISLSNPAAGELDIPVIEEIQIAEAIQQANADMELMAGITGVYDAIYSQSGLANTLNESMLDSDYAMWTQLHYINSINIVQNEDKTGVLVFNVCASFDKSGELDPHMFDVKYSLTEAEYNDLVSKYNVAEMYNTLAKSENQAKLNSLDMFKIFDLTSMKDSFETITKTIEGKECEIVQQDFIALDLVKSENENSYISPVIDKYFSVLAGSGSAFTDNFSDKIESMLDDAKPTSNKEASHTFTYEAKEDGSFDVKVYTTIGNHAPLVCNLKVSNTNILFSEKDLATAISNFFTNTEQTVTVEYANAEQAIANYSQLNTNSNYVFYVIETMASTDEPTFIFYIQEKHDVTATKGEDGKYSFTLGKPSNIVVNPDNTVDTDTSVDSELTTDEEITDSDVTTDDTDKEVTDSNTEEDLVEDKEVVTDVTVE